MEVFQGDPCVDFRTSKEEPRSGESNFLFPVADQFLTAQEEQEIASVMGELRSQTV